MSYLESLKEEVETFKQQRIESYQQYMSDYVVSSLAGATKSVYIEAKHLVSEDINVKDFIGWLEDTGIDVNSTDKALTFSLPE